jgi:hypothetical protein
MVIFLVSNNSSRLYLRKSCHECCLLVTDTIVILPRIDQNSMIAEYTRNYYSLLDPDYILISCPSAMLNPPSVNVSDDISTKF